MGIIIELAWFAASDAFIANHNLLNEQWSDRKKAETQVSSQNGIDLQNNETAYVINVWESLEKFRDHQSKFDPAEVKALLEGIAAPNAKPTLWLIETESTASGSSGIPPLTEVAIVTVKPGSTVSLDEIKAKVEHIAREVDGVKGVRNPVGWGTKVDSVGTVVMFVGWDSAEERTDGLKERLIDAQFDVETVLLKLRPTYAA